MSTRDDIDEIDVDWDNLETIKDIDVCDGSTMTKLMRNIKAGHLNATQLIENNGKIFGQNAFSMPIKTNPSAPFSLLVESLVQQLCQLMDPTNAEQRYTNICAQLYRMNLIDETYRMSEFDLMRSEYQHALYQLATVAQSQTDLPVALRSVWPVEDTPAQHRSWSRYHREFDELNFIAGGGFGQVYRARHRLDGVDYAVKKITIKYTTIQRVMSHLSEVKTFASLNHTNIVPYKAAWLEPFFNDPHEQRARSHRTRSQSDGYIEESSIDEEDDDDEDESDADDSLFGGDHSRQLYDDDTEASDFIQFESSENTKSSSKGGHLSDAALSSSPKADSINLICEYNNNNNKLNCKDTGRSKHPIDRSSSNSNVLNSQMEFNASQPHLKLKWATLYIQMALRPLTLRTWLDERNKSNDDFDTFYKDYLRRFVDAEGVDAADDDQSMGNRLSLSAQAFEETMCQEWHNDEIAINIFTKMLEGLNYIHLKNIIHHDIKPSNVFIGWERNGNLYVELGDFGLACPLQANHTRDGVMGTPAYAAPEQLSGQCNPKSDLYSLGIILIELLIPFKTDMERVKTIENARKGIFPSELPKRYVKLLKKLLQPHKKRPDTIELQRYIRKRLLPRMHCSSPVILRPSHNDTDESSANSDNEHELSEASEREEDLKRQCRELTKQLNVLKKQLSNQTDSSHNDVFENNENNHCHRGSPGSRSSIRSGVQQPQRQRSRKSSSSSLAADRLFVAQCLSENDSMNNDSLNDSQPDVSSSSFTDASFNDNLRKRTTPKKINDAHKRCARSPGVASSPGQVANERNGIGPTTNANDAADKDEYIAILENKLLMKDLQIQQLQRLLRERQDLHTSDLEQSFGDNHAKHI